MLMNFCACKMMQENEFEIVFNGMRRNALDHKPLPKIRRYRHKYS